MARTDSKWNKIGTHIESVDPQGVDILVNGTNKYINFNTLVGSLGYGFRDNNGVMEFKNDGGAWATFGAGGTPEVFEYANTAGFPATGATATIYIAADTNKIYRWDGAVYVELSAGGGGGTPATTVTSETSFGITPVVGVSTNYAREDHTHGSPVDPIPAHVADPDPHVQYTLSTELVAGLALKQENILFENEGSALGASGTVNEVDFVGAGVNAVRVGNKVTVTIAGGGSGSVTMTEIEVNMGDKSPSKRFTVTDAAITPANKIVVFPSPSEATGRRGNDWEIDQAFFTALAGTGDFLLSIVSPFRMRGYRKLYYQVV